MVATKLTCRINMMPMLGLFGRGLVRMLHGDHFCWCGEFIMAVLLACSVRLGFQGRVLPYPLFLFPLVLYLFFMFLLATEGQGD